MSISEERLEEIIYWNRLKSMSDWQEYGGFNAKKIAMHFNYKPITT